MKSGQVTKIGNGISLVKSRSLLCTLCVAKDPNSFLWTANCDQSGYCWHTYLFCVFFCLFDLNFFSNLVKFIFPLPVTISPQRPGHSLEFICNCEVQKDNISFIHQRTLSPVYTMQLQINL